MLVLLYVYINSTNIPPIMITNRIYEHQNLLSLQLLSFLVGLRTYQHPYVAFTDAVPSVMLINMIKEEPHLATIVPFRSNTTLVL